MIHWSETGNAEKETCDDRKPIAADLGILLPERAVRKLWEKGSEEYLSPSMDRQEEDNQKVTMPDMPEKLFRTQRDSLVSGKAVLGEGIGDNETLG